MSAAPTRVTVEVTAASPAEGTACRSAPVGPATPEGLGSSHIATCSLSHTLWQRVLLICVPGQRRSRLGQGRCERCVWAHAPRLIYGVGGREAIRTGLLNGKLD